MSAAPEKPDNGWPEVSQILEAALELEGSAQLAFINQACGKDEGLRREVQGMLAAVAQAQAKDFLASDAFAVGAGLIANQLEATDIPARVGQYKILREIGRGGMGAVFLAEREDPHQHVAIKIIKRGMDTDEIIGRFRRERQVLANLNHPHIAILLDASTTGGGLPYFVMEYVEGLAINEFCDQRKLNINERLALFQKICSAVSYIHRNLIIHRDIKPSNIIVSEAGEPKLLDFGIAKLLAQEPGMTVEQTAAEARLLTPDYASPEQILGEKITTASDIYALGVVLYELLSGRRPFRLGHHSTSEILEILAGREPSAPSTAVRNNETGADTNQSVTPETLADSRSEKLATLRRKLAGDLDNITLKALKKEPERRYQTVEQLSEDIDRYLTGLPVRARPDTFVYRAAKFARRNRVPVTLTSLLFAALVGGFFATFWQTVRANRQRALAEERAAETRRLANTLLTEFDEEIGNIAGGYPTRIKLLNASSEYLVRLARQTDDPTVMKEVAAAHLYLARAYEASISDLKQSERHRLLVVDISRHILTITPNDLTAKELLAEALSTLWTADKEVMRREALRLREEIVRADPDSARALENLAESYSNLADVLKPAHRDEALAAYHKSIEIRSRVIRALETKAELTADEYDVMLWSCLFNAITHRAQFDDWQPAVDYSRKGIGIALAAAAKFPNHRRTQTNLQAPYSHLARALQKRGDYRGALEQFEIALAKGKEIAVKFNLFWHASEVRYLLRIVELRLKLGEKEKAQARLREALALRRDATVMDRANPRNLHMHGDVFREAGGLFAQAGNFDAALAAYQEAEQTWQRVLHEDPGQENLKTAIATIHGRLGDLYALSPNESTEMKQRNRRRLETACDWYQRAAERFSRELTGLEPDWVDYPRLVNAKLAACRLALEHR